MPSRKMLPRTTINKYRISRSGRAVHVLDSSSLAAKPQQAVPQLQSRTNRRTWSKNDKINKEAAEFDEAVHALIGSLSTGHSTNSLSLSSSESTWESSECVCVAA